MSRDAAEFYAKRHEATNTYSGGHYEVRGLATSKAVNSWASRRTSPVQMLDIGCGKGMFLSDLCGQLTSRHRVEIGRIVGMDLVKSPGNWFERLPQGFEFVQGDVDGKPLPFESGAFDVVTCNHVLEHVFETENLVQEVRRVLKPDGVAVFSVPNIGAWINRLLLLLAVQPIGSEVGTKSICYGFWPPQGKTRLKAFVPSGHIRDFTPRGLKDLVEACGFQVGGWWNQDGSLVGKLSKWGSRNMGVIITLPPSS